MRQGWTDSRSVMDRLCFPPMANISTCISRTGSPTARLHIGNSRNNVAVARAPVSAVLKAAFESSPPHTVSFEKFYHGTWDLQPAVGGASTDLILQAPFTGYLDIHYNGVLKRYVLIISDDTNFAYAESIDALKWTSPIVIGTSGPTAVYPTAMGLGENPHILGAELLCVLYSSAH
jgi:hypothetical protein